MTKVSIISINKNPRYKILSSENHSYLLDLDQSFKFMLIPFYSWFCKVEVIEISSEEVSILKGDRKEPKKISIPIWSIGIMITLSRIFRHGASVFILDVPNIVNIVVLLICSIALIMLRIWLSKRSKKKVASLINMNRKMEKFTVLPFSLFGRIKKILFMSLILIYLIFFICVFVTIFHLLLLMIIILILFSVIYFNGFTLISRFLKIS